MKKKNYENYKNLNKIMNIKMLIAFILGAIISITSSYAIAETLIKSSDVSYVDNSKLGATNVQAAIDGTCTKFSNDLQSFLLKVYPVGSIYISYNSTNPGTLFGGTWEVFGKGQTLVGIDTSQTEFNSVGKTGGEKAHILTLDEMPSHNHGLNLWIFNDVDYSGGNEIYGIIHQKTGSQVKDYQGTSEVPWSIGQSGGSQAHNNLQPYITVYMYRRIK